MTVSTRLLTSPALPVAHPWKTLLVSMHFCWVAALLLWSLFCGIKKNSQYVHLRPHFMHKSLTCDYTVKVALVKLSNVFVNHSRTQQRTIAGVPVKKRSWIKTKKRSDPQRIPHLLRYYYYVWVSSKAVFLYALFKIEICIINCWNWGTSPVQRCTLWTKVLVRTSKSA